MNNVRFLIQVCKGIIRSQRVRRTLMFWDVMVVLLMMFFGSTVIWTWLRGHPLLFLGYWAVCAWLTLLAALLAVYDMAMVRLEARRAHDELKRAFLHREDGDSDSDSDSKHDSHTH